MNWGVVITVTAFSKRSHSKEEADELAALAAMQMEHLADQFRLDAETLTVTVERITRA